MDNPPFARLVFPGFIAIIWAIHYIVAWLRLPLLLMRAADGELAERPDAATAA